MTIQEIANEINGRIDAAFKAGAAAMRELAARECEAERDRLALPEGIGYPRPSSIAAGMARRIRSLPLPTRESVQTTDTMNTKEES